jgi:lipopolysaccharide transport system ATP-binding protein
MGNIALRVDSISKRYQIGAYKSGAIMRTSAFEALRKSKRFLMRQPYAPLTDSAPHRDDFWALRDVSFEVKHGETVGVIGRNGAGKSTLLKILSRITKPTRGHVDIYGRLGSLLEVGTGFHPELSGRENIYLNATILGLKKAEIISRFDEIVAFAEVEKFIDTPVKHYSSGMYMRLAFSVSAHLEPEILVLDEVLAVGDAAFQKKCMGKMENVAKQGRTVLLVSHSLAQIVSFCDRCLLLDEGKLIRDGSATEVSEYYQESLTVKSDKTPDIIRATKDKSNKARFTSIRLTPLGNDGKPQSVLRVGNDMEFEFTVLASERVIEANAAIAIFGRDDYRVIDANLALRGELLNLEPGEQAAIRFTLRNILLKPDTYRVVLWLGRPPFEDIDILPDAATFTVEIDPRKTLCFQTFPGVYQCDFTHSVLITQSGMAFDS